MAIFFTFAEKKFGCLFTTNIAARGLDFPSIDWIVQVDCPEDVKTYVHRVGRTARFKFNGKSLLLVLDSEMKFIDYLNEKNIQIHKINVKIFILVLIFNKINHFFSILMKKKSIFLFFIILRRILKKH